MIYAVLHHDSVAGILLNADVAVNVDIYGSAQCVNRDRKRFVHVVLVSVRLQRKRTDIDREGASIIRVQPIDVVLFFFNILNVDRQASEVADGHISAGSRIDAARIRAFDRERFRTRGALNVVILNGYVYCRVLCLRINRIPFDDTRDISGRGHRTRQRKADRRREHCFFHDETSLL